MARLEDTRGPSEESRVVQLARAAVEGSADMSSEEGVGRHHLAFVTSVLADGRLRSLALGRSTAWSDRMLDAVRSLTPTLHRG